MGARSSLVQPSVSQCRRARTGMTAMRDPSDKRVSATPKIPSPFDANGNVLPGMSGTVESPPFASNVKSPIPRTKGTDCTCSKPCVLFRLSHGYALHSWYRPACASRKQCFFIAKFGIPADRRNQLGKKVPSSNPHRSGALSYHF